MITKLNLATKPFRNRTLPYLMALLFLALAISGGTLSFAKLRNITAENEITKSEIEAMEGEVKALKGKGELVQQQLSPEQSGLLVAAHRLVANKNFGCSRFIAVFINILNGNARRADAARQHCF